MAGTELTRKLGAQLREQLAAQKINQIQASERYGVSQSWISRILDGEFTARSNTARRMCEDAGIAFLPKAPKQKRNPTRQRLQRELMETWDGTAEEAQKLAAILRAVRELKTKRSDGSKKLAPEWRSGVT